MGNLHAVAASAVTIGTSAETVVATLTAFNENEAGEFAQGVCLQAGLNVTPGTGATAVTLRIRKVSVTGATVGVQQIVNVTAAAPTQLSIDELDTTLIQPGIVYVLSVQQTGASASGTANRVVFTAEVASAFD